MEGKYIFKIAEMKYCYLSLVVFLFSCNNTDLAEFQISSFEDNRWYKTEPLTLTFNNKNKNLANVLFTMGYVYGSQFSEIPLEVYITSPLHQIDKIPVTLLLFDANKNELGNCVGDFCDITQILIKNYAFNEVGNYKIQLLNTFNYPYIPNVNSVTVKIRKTKKN